RRGRDVKVHDAEAGIGDIAHLDLALRGGHRPGVAVAADRLRETGGPARQVLRLGEEFERVPRRNVDLDALCIVSHDAAPLVASCAPEISTWAASGCDQTSRSGTPAFSSRALAPSRSGPAPTCQRGVFHRCPKRCDVAFAQTRQRARRPEKTGTCDADLEPL